MREHAVFTLMMAVFIAFGCKSGGGGESNDTGTGTGETPQDTGTGEAPEDTGSGEATEDTGTGDAPDDTGTGEAPEDTGTGYGTPCAGVTCNTPPDNECSGSFGIAIYNRVGWCDRGECHYGYRQEECETGVCEDGVCTGNPCQGVTCDEAPANECTDDETLRIYNPVGHCADSDGTPGCDYFSVEVTCDGGCADGACVGDPCAHVVCDEPPARYCDEEYLMVWDTVARCENGECTYHTQAVDCGPAGCADGACTADDPCANVVCGTPPANRCVDDDTLRAYNAEGACDDGTCLFGHEDLVCPAGCADGRCIDDACVGIPCETAPVSRCTDDETLVFWDGEPGTCTDGVCAYGVGDATCDGGCAQGQCTGDPCIGVLCLDPPADYCRNETSLVTYAVPGVCTGDGRCGYELELETCLSCDMGVCTNDEPDTETEETDTGTGEDTDTGTGEPADTDTDTGTGEPLDTETATAEEPDGGIDTEPDTDTGTGEPTDTGTGAEPATACTEETATEDCGGNPCVDGYCCDLPCAGDCEACDIEGSEGHCTLVPEGEDPDEECLDEASYTCGTKGFCDGAGECAIWEEGTICDDGNSCNGDEDTCNGEGRCQGGEPLPDFTACELVTEPDRDYDICVSGYCVSPGCGDISCNVPGPHFPLADTSHRQCYDGGSAVISCPAEGEDYYGQDAQYGWDMTHSEMERFYRDVSIVGEPIVEDNVTGFIWQGEEAPDGGMAWADALAYCDSLDWSGYSDWRLPDIYELSSIVDRRVGSPSLYTGAFPDAPEASFWTTTTYAGDTTDAWYVYFVNGQIGFYSKTGSASMRHVRCVRGAPTPHPTRFTRDTTTVDEPVVSHGYTDLMWQGCPAGTTGTLCNTGAPATYAWMAALAYCEDLSWAGHEDWRLPNVIELQSIVQYNTDIRSASAIDSMAFPATPESSFWTSSKYYSSNYYLGIIFDIGDSDNFAATGAYNVRCVRDVTAE